MISLTKRSWKSIAYALAGTLVFLASAPEVLAQKQDQKDLPEMAIDPIAFRGPDPKEQFGDIQIEQKLEAQIPLGLEFKNEEGETVTLDRYFGEKPVLLTLVYFECPMLCTLVLNGVIEAMDAPDMTLKPGEDFEILTVSIDPGEGPALAREKKANNLEQLEREVDPDGWHFLTGDEEAIETLATAVGFRYFYDEELDQYAHAAGIMLLTPEGKVSSYMLGLQYDPKQMRLALVDASEGEIGSLADQLVLLCYAYDPSSGGYGFYVMGAIRIVSVVVVLMLLTFWGVMWLRSRRKQAGPREPAEAH